ncbi:hypothetical protein G6F46_011184 [Rhizopus delemar]|uniref:Uncharacterized protein n=3 Tax=Rhizopus TaxID=4842 RepID=I1C303_RHIO9|nr:hypothetical protein RO3G_07538 [Rhizopus delemar RA 99-880]KAG1044071.1 hypothetical protein G6F43_011508 [Rhizopus delemar]KAG1536035.1 hypothetical protein G6F51_011191 [Rhizopus arrhizus]KAG1457837.1 hypothetical protein G6F55_005696 [Rhizopus delemar]KAG1490308.1 hypothetical protein G6F54_010816 [Rhizopus delemar]|eukprot:EIE82833.1 hypothetical protein RO3G_07538 [Rhizopus delemar RA 99-880]
MVKSRASPALQLSFILLLSCQLLQVYAQTLYSVILNSPETDAGVVIDNQIYILSPSVKSDIVLQAKAPGGRPYYYAKLRKGTSEIIDREKFTRNPVMSKWTFNEFYNRNWNAKKVLRFNPISIGEQNYDRVDDFDLHPDGEISTIHVTAHPRDMDRIHDKYLDDIDIETNITHITATTVKHFVNCGFSISGRTSRYFNKLPYIIKIPKNDYNLNGFRHIKLRTTDNDPSYIREYLTTEILRAVNQPATRASFARVYFNDRPIGLFIITEKYDTTWLNQNFNRQRDKVYYNGILYEGHGGRSSNNRADLSFKGLGAFKDAAYEISEAPSKGENSFNELNDFTKFINDQSTMMLNARDRVIMENTAAVEWEKHIDVDGFLANMAVEFFLGFGDGYLQNTNNYYLYKDPQVGRFVYIPWDFDYNMGNGPFKMESILVGDYSEFGKIEELPLTAGILSVPKYRQRFEDILFEIATKIMDTKISFPVIDSVVNLIREDVAWDQALDRVKRGPSYVNGAVRAFFEHKLDENYILSHAASISATVEYLFRVNKVVDFDVAINGRTRHVSLLGLKEYFKSKLANYNMATGYKKGLVRELLQA